MKKIILVLIVMLCLVGCKPSGTPDPKPDPEPDPTPVVTDTGLSQDELFTLLSQKGYYHGPDYYIVDFGKDGTAGFGILGSSYFVGGKISDFKYEGNNKYSFKINVPAFAGNEMEGPYDAYTIDMTLVYDQAKRSVVHVTTKEATGNFVANPFGYPFEDQFSDDTAMCYIDNHYVGYLYGTQGGGSGEYEYFMKLFCDDKEIPCGMFGEKEQERVIWSQAMAANFFAVRIYDTIYMKSKIAKMINGSYIVIIDTKTNTVIKEFRDYDVYEEFDYDKGLFRFAVGQYPDSFSDPKDYGVYAITEDGLIKITE